MTTKTDITLPPLPRYMDSVTAEEFDRRVLAWGRAAVEADRQGRMPSDAEILACLRPLYSNDVAAAMGAEDDLRTARLLLSRYGSGQPAAPVAQEPVARVTIYMHQGRRQFSLAELGTKAAGDLGVGAHNLFAAPVAARATVSEEVRNLRRALVYVAHALHGTPQYMLADGITLVGGDGVIVKRDEYTVVANTSEQDAAPVATQAQPTMPPLTDSMRAVLRNEHEVYESEDALYAALCDAAGAQPVVNQSLMTGDEVKALYVRHFGGDAGWLDIRGSFFIEGVRAALVQQPSGQDREDAADMFWDADDPERFGGDNLHDTLVDLADDYGDPDFPVTVRLQCAKRLPDVQVVVTGRNDDGELVYEVIDTARAAKGEA